MLSLDTYDGSYNKKRVYYPMQRLTDAEMHAAGANPTAEKNTTITKQIIPDYHINSTDVAQLADADQIYPVQVGILQRSK